MEIYSTFSSIPYDNQMRRELQAMFSILGVKQVTIIADELTRSLWKIVIAACSQSRKSEKVPQGVSREVNRDFLISRNYVIISSTPWWDKKVQDFVFWIIDASLDMLAVQPMRTRISNTNFSSLLASHHLHIDLPQQSQSPRNTVTERGESPSHGATRSNTTRKGSHSYWRC